MVAPDTELESRLGLAIAEYLERRRSGSAPEREDFVRAHPEIADALRSCLGILSALPGAGEAGEIPSEFGGYRLLREVGRGGMGVVYEAEQKSLGRRVALKVLPPLGAGNPERAQRFRREIEVTARLQHPNIVPVFEHGQVGGLPYYAMPLFAGEALDGVVRRFRSDPAQAPLSRRAELVVWVQRFVDVARALHYAHGAGVLHRDIKPSNLFLEETGRLLILDFGLTRTSAEASLTGAGSPVGTPRYMSPEQILGGQRPVDGRSDLFSLAATMYELFTLRPAFSGEEREAVFRAILAEDPVPPRRVDGRMPRDLEVVLLKALEKEPDRRYPGAQAFADDLERFLDYTPVQARPVGVLGRLQRRVRRNPVAALSAGFALVVLVASVLWPVSEALARGRAVERLVSDAQERLTGGDFEQARDLCLQALAHEPENTAARGLEQAASVGLRSKLEAERRAESEQAARAEIDAALGSVEHRRQAERRLADLRAEAETERKKTRPWTPLPIKEPVLALEREERLTRQAREAASRETFSHLLTAFQLRPEDQGARRELARLAFEEFVEAEKRRDRESMEALGPLIEDCDDGSLRREWSGEGSIAIASVPPGAEVYLFRFEPRDHFAVPVPFTREQGPVEGRPGPASTDGPWVHLLIEEEVPCQGGESLLPGDELLVVCGDPAASPTIVRDHYCAEPVHWLEVLREGAYHVLRLPKDMLEELPGEVVRRDPLEWTCALSNRVGATPIGPLVLPMGSYLALLRHPGFPDVNLPFEITRLEEQVAEVRLFSAAEIGAGFVHVPAGPAVLGGDRGARSTLALEERELPDYFIGRLEVTFREYLDFVRSLQQTDPEEALLRLPRTGAKGAPLLELDEDGGIQILERSIELEHPVVGITFRDAQAYCRWLTVTLGDPAVSLGLPTQAEWEKAARGADGRAFPWGNGYDPTLARTGLSSWLTDAVAGGLYPADCSVYGVLDLVGNVSEFCERDGPVDSPFEVLRGGSWFDRVEGDCHPANVANTLQPDELDHPPRTGFRVVKHVAR